MRRLAVLAALFLFPALTFGQELKVDGEKVKTFTVVSGFPCTVTAPKGASWYKWSVPTALQVKPSLGNVLEVTGGAKGQYAVTCDTLTIDFKAQTVTPKTYTDTITIGDVPDPGPGPDPGPDPLPFETRGEAKAGLRVFIVYESAELSKLPPGQALILTSQPVRQYLNAACMTEPDGKTKAYRMWDKDVQGTEADLKTWAGALKRPHASLPWLIVSNGRTWHEGPLPADVDSFLTLVKKYEK